MTERATGDILRIPKDGGKAKRVMSVPGVDGNAGEGGLLGLVLLSRLQAGPARVRLSDDP